MTDRRRSDPHEIAESITHYISVGAPHSVVVGPVITQNGKTHFDVSMPRQEFEVTVRLKEADQ